MKKYRYITYITVLLILLLWFISTTFGWIDTRIFPSPKDTYQALVSILVDGYKGNTVLTHLAASMYRLFIAFALAVITGTIIGLTSGYSRKLSAVFEPIIEFYRPLPPLAYYTLLVLWMGIENESKIALLYLACLPPIYISCYQGVKRVSPLYVQSASVLGADSKKIFMHVILPSCLPDIFTGMRTAIGVGYSTVVAAEMVAATSGIGWMVLDASNYLRNDIVFAGILIMSLTGICMDQILRILEKKIVPWKGKM